MDLESVFCGKGRGSDFYDLTVLTTLFSARAL
jgi:hypothetical protein